MEITDTDIAHWVGTLMWPFIRIGSFLLVVPVFGAPSVTRRVRIVLAMAVALLILPALPQGPSVAPFSPGGLLITAQQVLLGVAMGLVFQLAFATVVIAGQNIAMTMGLGFASAIDPQNGIQVPVVSQFYLILATLLFLSLDGHLLLLELVRESFLVFPVGTSWPLELPWTLVMWGSTMFASGLLIALPALAALLLINLSFGVMTRAAPQLNIFVVGFPISLIAGFLLIYFTLPAFYSQMSQAFDQAFSLARTMLSP